MYYRSLLPRDVLNGLAEIDRLQRSFGTAFNDAPQIRGPGRDGYPALNVGTTPTSVEVWAFVPGVAPATLDVQIDRGVLSISGERTDTAPASDAKTTLHVHERFAGRFRRVVNLPDDADASAVSATCRDGVLRVSVQRRPAAQARRIAVQ